MRRPKPELSPMHPFARHLSAIAVLLVLAAAAHADVQYGPVVHPTNGSSYYLLTASTWSQAEAEAVGLGGHLASIGSADENNWIWETFGPVAGSSVWIGFNDADQEGTFVWTDGASVTYTNWWVAGGQPSNDGGIENYAEMNNYVWNDNQDSASFPGVVEVAPAQPIHVRVDWSSALAGAQGSGTLSGSFGVFTVSEPGQVFPLPAGAALTATASGFSSDFANRDYTLDIAIGGLALRFDSLDPVTTTLVGDPGEGYPSRYSSLSACGDQMCRVIIARYVSEGFDLFSAGRGVLAGGTYNETSSDGQAVYTYTQLPEPAAIGTAAALLTLASLRRDRRAAPRHLRSH